MKELNLQLSSPGRPPTPLTFQVRRMVNLGYTGRNQAAVRAHIEELRLEGVPPPPSVPLCIPVLSQNITTDEEIEVVGGKTSGEAEVVFLVGAQEIYLGVGSDHTDRELECQSIVKSKQVCANVVSKEVWRYEEVAGRWDDLVIQSFVQAADSSAIIPYQEGKLAALLQARELLDLVRTKLGAEFGAGLVIYSGTVPIKHGAVNYGPFFRCELSDPVQKRSLVCAYIVKNIE